jgi:hypothetical protein
MTNTTQRLLENVEQHVKAHAIEIKWARQARLMTDVARRVEQCRVVCAEDQL